MDVAYFFCERVAFIAEFYRLAAPAFEDRINAIEAELPPFDGLPAGFDPEAGEPPYMREWQDANDGLQLLGQAAVSSLSDALKLFFGALADDRGFKLTSAELAPKKGFVRAYAAALTRVYQFDWSICPVELDEIEQIVLARNLVQHGTGIVRMDLRHSEGDLTRFNSMVFANPTEERMWRDNEFPVSLLRPRLSINSQNLARALDMTVVFVKWVDESTPYWKPRC